MSFFQAIEGDAVILVENGIYKQVDLYKRDGYLYAKLGSGFIRLMADGSTSKAKTRIDFLSSDDLYKDKLGRLCTSKVPNSFKLSGPTLLQLTHREP